MVTLGSLEQDKQARFEKLVLINFKAAQNFARCLMRNEHDAQDVVQEAFLRAYKFFGGFHGDDSRGWLLSIVRNAVYPMIEKRKKRELAEFLHEESFFRDVQATDPHSNFLQNGNRELVLRGLEELPEEFREVMVLRELKGMSYKEIAGTARVPIGTVMSRLARARKLLHKHLTAEFNVGDQP